MLAYTYKTARFQPRKLHYEQFLPWKLKKCTYWLCFLFQDLDETLSERLWGLTEMFPKEVRDVTSAVVSATCTGIKGYHFVINNDFLTVSGVCHGSGHWLTACRCGDLCWIWDHYVWNLWWAKWHWDWFFSEYLSFLLPMSLHQFCTLVHSSLPVTDTLLFWQLRVWLKNKLKKIQTISFIALCFVS